MRTSLNRRAGILVGLLSVAAQQRCHTATCPNAAFVGPRHLNRLPVHSRRPIAVIGDKGVLAIEAVLGAVVTGRPYCFLNPMQKRPRLLRMVSLLRPSVIVNVGSEEPDHDIDTLRTVAGPSGFCELEKAQIPQEKSQLRFDSTGAAYVLFTSGSSGEPSGVIVSHVAAAGAQKAFIDYVGLSADDVVSSEVALNFDVSTFDVFATLAVGGVIDLTPECILTRPADFLDHIERTGITSLFTVPTVARQLL